MHGKARNSKKKNYPGSERWGGYSAALLSIVALSAGILLSGCDKRTTRLRYLVGDPSLNDFYSVEKDSVTMYATPEDKKSGAIECRIYKDEYDIFIKMFRVLDDETITETYRSKGAGRFGADFVKKIRSLDEGRFKPGANPAKPLEGLRVAIDPGHSAGTIDEAIKEDKYVILFAPDGSKYRFYEARLNLATARELRALLQAKGATVMLTRDAERQVFPVPYDAWVRRDFRSTVREKTRDRFITSDEANRLLRWATPKGILKFFNSEVEMPCRAKRINEFRPHITVLVHYDANDIYTVVRDNSVLVRKALRKRYRTLRERQDEIRDAANAVSETKRDCCAVFVPGCFLANELNPMQSRIEFLRLIISPDLDGSVRYSNYVIDNFTRYLGVPLPDQSYPGASTITAGNTGVYARNFRMTRLVRGALCLGEPLQQNNLKEAPRLAEIDEGKVPPRVRTVARAYYDAIRKFVLLHLNMP